jgi:iron complex outermembrane receptor protein
VLRVAHVLATFASLLPFSAVADPDTPAPDAEARDAAEADPAGSDPPPDRSEPPEELLIKGRRTTREEHYSVSPERSTPSAADASELMDLVPGGAVNWNGPLSGQVQYRGMYGYRMNVRVDGMYVDPGGPNWMDPPLHYAPRPLLDNLEVERGIASVSSGAESIGGSVRATLKQSAFGEGPEFEPHADLELEGRSVDRSISGGGVVSFANERHRLHLLGSAERGRNTSSPDGKIRPTRFERYQFGSGYGLRLGEHRFGANFRYNQTDRTGTPALPMDIGFVHTYLWNGEYSASLGDANLEARIYYSDIDHKMDNFSLRDPPSLPRMPGVPDPTAFRFVKADGKGLGWDLRADFPLPLGRLHIGGDGFVSKHDMNVFNPNNAAFFVKNFNDVKRNRFGGFAEWRSELFEQVTAELGVRYVRVQMDAGEVDALPAQLLPPPMRLRDGFNASNRDKSDDNVDWVVKLAWSPREELSFELAAGRKTRSPYYIERYQWIPLEVTAGLADGNNYVGNVGLDPEVSHEVTGGFTWNGWRLYVAPRGFYRRVDDYIQGTPSTDPDVILVSTANGDPTPLEFTNVDAELYGADADAGIDLPGPLQIDGTLSYVRGKRRDGGDNLYRIAPLRGRATLSWQAQSWFAAVEGIFADEQDEVSEENGETETGGWAIMNLYAGWQPGGGLRLMAGIDNVTDERYRDHLAGFNRVSNSGVALGKRLPGPSRNFYGRIGWRW